MISLNFTNLYKYLPSKKPHPKSILWGLILVILAGSAFGSFYFYNTNQTALKKLTQLTTNTSSTADDSEKTITDLAKLLLIPTDDTPTIAVISDISKLANQPFFTKAQNGDKIIVFPKSQKVVLYRPSTNKVVDMTIFTNSPSPSPNP